MPSEQNWRVLPVSRHNTYDSLAAVLLLALLILVFVTAKDYGISNDEKVQQHYGELIIAYYTSGFTNRALFSYENLYLYGGLFDVLVALIAKVLPFDLYIIRHVFCALIGVGGIAATWATARLVAGQRAGLIAAAALAVAGVWYGEMFNHTKDITFASAMMGATYALLRSARDLPRPRWRDTLLFGLMLGCALGLRVVGVLMGFYLALIILLKLYHSGITANRNRLVFVGRSVLAFIPGLLLAYVIMIAFWPYAALGLFNPVRALFAFEQFKYEIRDLYAGKAYLMNEMPRSYLPVYLSIKLPLLVLAGSAAAIAFAAVAPLSRRNLLPWARYEVALLAFIVLLPVMIQVAIRGPIFSGMRHFTFVVPPLAALAGIGWHLLIAAFDNWRRPAGAAVAAVLVAAVLWNAIILVRLHPYEYLFYNPLVGGLKGAQRRYATDYWVNSMPEAVRGLKAFLARTGVAQQRHSVAICCDESQFEWVAGDRLYWTDDWDKAEFFIAPTHMDCDRILPGKVIFTVERLGVVIAVVKDRRALLRSGATQKKP
jgi:Dolichyl-phosphate-mannose-protein mannosyltransferase